MDLLDLFLKYPSICTDTRKIKKGDLFFALKGNNFNGNQFAQKAIEAGASYAIIDEEQYVSDYSILVKDVLTSLQNLATAYRKHLDIPVIAVTGSNGKTTTKELITRVLAKKYSIFSTAGNLNNHIGVPLSILSIEKNCEIAVLELGANHLHEIEILCEIAKPDYGFITNCGMDHLEGYGSIEGVIKGSAELFEFFNKNGGTAFINKEDQTIVTLKSILDKDKTQTISYPSQIKIAHNNFYLQLIYKDTIEINTHLIGDYNFSNVACAVAIGEYFKVEDVAIKEAIESYVPQNNRSQVVEKNGAKVILDAYNANPSSMELAVRNFSNISAAQKIVILGDMFEMGHYAAEAHHKMVELVLSLDFDTCIFCGEEFYKHQKTGNSLFFKTRDELKNWFEKQNFAGTTLLLKGSRGMALEKLILE
ncbi:MAG: UDP-N-acetylmuramoyl-tripeptide--D-alanyl-D-alanine ligase [Cytophagales bacterium]